MSAGRAVWDAVLNVYGDLACMSSFLDKSSHSTLPDLGLRFFCVGYFNCIFLNMQFKNCIFRSNLVLTFRKTSLKAKMMSWFCLVIYFNYALFFILEKSIAYLFIWKRSNEKWGWTREANGGTNVSCIKKDWTRIGSLALMLIFLVFLLLMWAHKINMCSWNWILAYVLEYSEVEFLH